MLEQLGTQKITTLKPQTFAALIKKIDANTTSLGPLAIIYPEATCQLYINYKLHITLSSYDALQLHGMVVGFWVLT
jgi:hypothetical protein